MNMHDTIQKLKELLVTKLKLKIGVDQIKEDTLLFGSNSLGLDSIDVLELMGNQGIVISQMKNLSVFSIILLIVIDICYITK